MSNDNYNNNNNNTKVSSFTCFHYLPNPVLFKCPRSTVTSFYQAMEFIPFPSPQETYLVRKYHLMASLTILASATTLNCAFGFHGISLSTTSLLRTYFQYDVVTLSFIAHR